LFENNLDQVATALTTGNALVSHVVGTESIIPEPEELEASNLPNIWAQLHIEETFNRSAAVGRIFAYTVENSLAMVSGQSYTISP
jgi:hypothetical protein